MTKPIRRTHAQWKTINEQYLASGLKIGEFCDQYGVSYQSFYGWRRKNAGQKQSAPDFIELSALEPSSNQQGWNIVLRLGNGVELQLSQSV